MTRWLVATALGITLATSVEALNPIIPPPLIDDPSLQPVCVAINLSGKPRDIEVTILNDAGATLGTTSCPQESGSCRVAVNATSGVVYCMVTDPTRLILATLMLVDTNGVVRISTESHYED